MSPDTHRMSAAVLYGKEQLRIERVSVPQLGPGDVLVRVRAALTCGTDVKVFRRGYHAKMIVPPAVFGHEMAGIVEEVAPGVESFEPGAFEHALNRLGLERLQPHMDQTQRWDRDLSQDEQIALAFARILMHKPAWVLVDDTFGSLDDETLERVTDVFAQELAQTGLINIGRAAQSRDPFFSRVLHLVKASPNLTLAHDATSSSKEPAGHS